MNNNADFKNKRGKTTSQRRKQIFDTAIHLFNQKGIAHTTVREIAEATGLTIGGLYYFIKSKDEIIDIVTENSMYFHEAVKNFRKTLGNVSPTEAFRACVNYWLTVSPSAMEQTIFFEREKIHMAPDMREKHENIVRNFIHFFEDLLKEGIAAGEFSIDNITLVAFHTYMLRGLFAVKQWFLEDLITSEEYAIQMTNAVLKQILVDRSKVQV